MNCVVQNAKQSNVNCTLISRHKKTTPITECIFLRLGMHARFFFSACTDVSVFTMGVTILEACVTICYQVYKAFFAGPRSLDVISRFVFCKFSLISLLFVSIHYT